MNTQTDKPSPVVQHSAEILGGALVFSGTRVPFQTLIDYLKAGESLDDFLEDFPTVSRAQVFRVLDMARETLMRQSDASPIG